MIAFLALAHAATFVVDTTNNNGTDSLREALDAATSTDQITFSTGVFPTGQVTAIVVTGSALPTLNANLVADGRVHIVAGAGLPASTTGLEVGGLATVSGLELSGFSGDGIEVVGAQATLSSVTVYDNDQAGVRFSSTSGLLRDSTIGLPDDGNCAAASGPPCAGVFNAKHQNDVLRTAIDATIGSSVGRGSGVFVRDGVLELTDSDIGLAVGNGSFGVLVVGGVGESPSAYLDGNVVVNNGKSGVFASRRSSGVSVLNGFIGVDSLGAIAGNGQHGVHLQASDDHLVQGNVIGGNTASGVVVDGSHGGNWASGNVVRDNQIGVYGFSTFVGNGSWGIDVSTKGLGTVLDTNMVADNLAGGIQMAASGEIVNNLVGASSTIEAGNGGHGIRVNQKSVDVVSNQVLDNSLDGIRLGPNSDDVLVAENELGFGLLNQSGNLGDGIHVFSTISNPSITVRHNHIKDSGGIGLNVQTTFGVGLERNIVSNSGSCGVYSINPGNTQLTLQSPTSVTFAVTPPSGLTVTQVEVFHDPEDEALTPLGFATQVGDGWLLTLPSPAFNSFGRYAAIATFSDGSSSRLTPGCQDGCSNNSNSTCSDGDPCTLDVCGAMGCSSAASATLLDVPCSDGDAGNGTDVCTVLGTCINEGDPSDGTRCFEEVPGLGAVRATCNGGGFCNTMKCNPDTGCTTNSAPHNCDDGNDCTADWCTPGGGGTCNHSTRQSGFLCDDGNECTGFGQCDVFGQCSQIDTEKCTAEGGCTTATCDPARGCTYTPKADGYCSVSEFCDLDNFRAPMPDCAAGLADNDGDGFPNTWEAANSVDTDCDGVLENLNTYFGEANPSGGFWLDPDEPDIFMEVDYMPTTATEDYRPSASGILTAEAGFLAGGGSSASVRLHVVVDDEVPFAQRMSRRGGAPADPDCTDWASIADYKRRYFAPERRNWFHYVVSAHQAVGFDASSAAASDGICVAETPGGIGQQGAQSKDDAFGVGAGGDEIVLGEEGSASDNRWAQILFHELGHNLGVSHDGWNGSGGNYSVNYVSSMNYHYNNLISDPTGGKVVDFSRRTLASMNETNVNEQALLTTDLGVVRWLKIPCPPTAPVANIPDLPPDAPVDWNCDGDDIDSGLAIDLNANGATTSILDGDEDWTGVLARSLKVCKPDLEKHDPQRAAPEDGESISTPTRLGEADLAPGCDPNELANNLSGQVEYVVYGDVGFNVSQLINENLMGADYVSVTAVDDDGDGHLDHVYLYDVADLIVTVPDTKWLYFEAWYGSSGNQLFVDRQDIVWVTPGLQCQP